MLYGVGFLVVNAYLGGFGVRDLEPLRARYVAAAIPFLLMAAVAALVGVRSLELVMRVGTGRSIARLVLQVCAAFGAIVVASFFATLATLASLRAEIPFRSDAIWGYLWSVAAFGTTATATA